MVNVLIADDTATSRMLLRHIIHSAGDMRVVGEAQDGVQAVDMTQKLRPDIVLMDISMPRMDGLEATRLIMQSNPTPIVMVTASYVGRETEVAFQAVRLGALTVLGKPVGPTDPDYLNQVNRLLSTVRAMSNVRVIHHRRASISSASKQERTPDTNTEEVVRVNPFPRMLAIGSSTGGPAALSEILRGLPANFPVPIVIAQHITPDFLPSLCQWLNSMTALNVHIAAEGEFPQPGNVYLADGTGHLILKNNLRFGIDHQFKSTFTPSCDALLSSVAKIYGAHAMGIILTGMGSDGARGLLELREQGALTIAQDEQSSVVYGMPREAVENGAARHIMSVQAIGALLHSLPELKRGES